MTIAEELTIDDIFAMAAEKGLKAREWKWKKLLDYNGFTSDQRVKKFQAIHLAIQLGLIPPATDFPCDICGATYPSSSIGYHSEDYSTITEQYPLCKSCHTQLHMRFRNPKTWRESIEKYGNGTMWWETLTLDISY